MAGIAGGADMVLVPEVRFTMDEVCRELKARYMAGKKYSIVVVAEGIHHEDISPAKVPECDRDECGHEKFVGAGNLIGKEIEKRLGIETRVTVLGHVQRGGTPTAFDRILGNPVRCGSSRAAGSGKYRFHGCPAGFPDRYSSLKRGCITDKTGKSGSLPPRKNTKMSKEIFKTSSHLPVIFEKIRYATGRAVQ